MSISSFFSFISLEVEYIDKPLEIKRDPNEFSLNIYFPDQHEISYLYCFHSQKTIEITGIVPDCIFVWTLLLCNNQGIPIQHWNYTHFLSYKNHFTIMIGPHLLNSSDNPKKGIYYDSSKEKDFLYVMVQTIKNIGFHSFSLPRIRCIDPKYRISISLKYPVHPPSSLQTLIYKCFHTMNKHSKIHQRFRIDSDQNIYQFFYCPFFVMDARWPNPNTIDLIVFPIPNPYNVPILKVKGRLYEEIGYQYPVGYVSIVAGNWKTTKTDQSVCFSQLPLDYTIFVIKKEDPISVAIIRRHGYTELNSKMTLLYWDVDNEYPIVLYRIVYIPELATPMNDPWTNPQLSMFRLTAHSLQNIISHEQIQKWMGEYYPLIYPLFV